MDNNELENALKDAETKAPAPAPAPVVNSEPTAGPSISPSFWDDVEIEKPAPTTPTPAGLPKPGDIPPPNAPLTKAAIDSSARAAVATLNLTQTMLFRPLIKWRFKKHLSEKFTPEDLATAWSLNLNAETPADDKEKTLKKRISNYLNQFETKNKELPFSTTEEKDLESAFRAYFEITQKTLSPETMLYVQLAAILGRRGIDAFVWE
jgi:hypothetical protein